MLKTNSDKLVKMALQAHPRHPAGSDWQIDHQGKPFMTPRTGGITYNVKVGDSVYGLQGDHIEPGVTTMAGLRPKDDPNKALHTYVCIGNTAIILSGDAKGEQGVVTGHHGGVENIIVDFPDDVLYALCYDDRILFHAFGQGLQLLDWPDITCMNIDPRLLGKLQIKEHGGRIVIPVAARIPAFLMASGLGSTTPFRGDFDIQTSDPETLRVHSLQSLRFGDVVAISDYGSTHGWSYKPGQLTIGIIIHGDSFKAGHGPGVASIMSGPVEKLETVINFQANIGFYLGIGRYRKD